MPLAEHVARDPDFDLPLVDCFRLQEFRCSPALQVPAATNAVTQIHGVATGGHIHQLGGEIRIRTVCRRVENDLDGSGNFRILHHRRTGVDEYIAAHLHGPLIMWSPGDDVR